MDLDRKLAGRANAVAAFFRPYPPDQAAAGVRDHIAAFWTPAMREAILTRAEAGGAGLDPVVVAALLDPAPAAAAPGRPETAGPREAGALGADDAG